MSGQRCNQGPLLLLSAHICTLTPTNSGSCKRAFVCLDSPPQQLLSASGPKEAPAKRSGGTPPCGSGGRSSTKLHYTLMVDNAEQEARGGETATATA